MDPEAATDNQPRLGRRLILIVGAITLVDMLSQLALTFRGWSGSTPLQQIAGLQTAGTQASIAILALTLLGLGLSWGAWSRQRQWGVVAVLLLVGLVAGWLAAGIPELTRTLLADLAFTEPERLARGSRQALAGWLTFTGWAVGMAWVMARQLRSIEPLP